MQNRYLEFVYNLYNFCLKWVNYYGIKLFFSNGKMITL